MTLLSLASSLGNNLLQGPIGLAVYLFPDTLYLGYERHTVNTEKYVYCLGIHKAIRMMAGIIN